MGQRLMHPGVPNLDSGCLQCPKIVSLFYVLFLNLLKTVFPEFVAAMLLLYALVFWLVVLRSPTRDRT